MDTKTVVTTLAAAKFDNPRRWKAARKTINDSQAEVCPFCGGGGWVYEKKRDERGVYLTERRLACPVCG